VRTLYVLRHAKSDWGDPSLKDFDRPLNERGRKAARAMGKEMRRQGAKPDLVLASPAVRAQQTLERVQDGFGEEFAMTNDHRIYNAELSTLIDVVRSAPDNAKRVMIVGHNPGFQELVLALTSGPVELREEVAEGLPTGALAELSFDRKSWSDIAPGPGRLERLTKPRDL
jgi:phosphohistidine phosphatase